MGGFLEFLSNNYIYFLIAAGVLFFALIGLLVDLKKKQGTTQNTEQEIPNLSEEVSIPEPEEIKEETLTMNEPPIQESFNPAPPMPSEEPTSFDSVNEVSIETPVENTVAPMDETPVLTIENSTQGQTNQPEMPTEELK